MNQTEIRKTPISLPWAVTAQKYFVDLASTKSYDIVDHYSAKYLDTNPDVRKPFIGNDTVHSMSSTFYEYFDSVIDNYHIAALSLNIDMNSINAVRTHENLEPDLIPDLASSHCSEINKLAFDFAWSQSSEIAKSRYLEKGQKLEFGADQLNSLKFIYNYKFPEYISNEDNSILSVYSPAYFDGDSHNCKLISPARFMEWIYFDGLRAKCVLYAQDYQKPTTSTVDTTTIAESTTSSASSILKNLAIAYILLFV